MDNGLRTFGWSVSGGMDLDGNEYPDVLVGAYESANAVYLRSAPVVHLDSKVTIANNFRCYIEDPILSLSTKYEDIFVTII